MEWHHFTVQIQGNDEKIKKGSVKISELLARK